MANYIREYGRNSLELMFRFIVDIPFGIMQSKVKDERKWIPMATILPFNGILYNTQLIGEAANVTAPPYDVISPDEQATFHERHPNNVIRLILNPQTDADTVTNNPHTRSANFFRQWIAEGILQRDNQEALYLKAITYIHGSETITRYGLTARVGIEPFEKRIVLPHEKTFSKVKSERLHLLKATHCNYCPIFSLYPDDGDIFATLRKAVADRDPIVNFIDDQNHRHRLWRITDPEIHRQVTESMQPKRLFIADGHHRYETALNFRNHLKDTDPSFDEKHPANYVMMYLCSMSDPGLIILPAHRLVKAVSAQKLEKALGASKTYFDVARYPFGANNRQAIEETFLADLHDKADCPSIGIHSRHSQAFYLLSLKSGVMNDLFGEELDESVRNLDVTVLTRLLFMKILGFDQERLDDETLIEYASTADKAFAAIDSGEYDVAFILNPTRIEQVQEVAQKGLIMPRKSTYFYPKVRSGLVMNILTPDGKPVYTENIPSA